MLNSIKLKSKKIICCLILCLTLICTMFTGSHLSKPISVDAASSNQIVEDVSSTVVGSGYNFNVTTSSKPATPSGWTVISGSSTNENIVKGVVNVESATSFDTEECETVRPLMDIEDKGTEDNPAYYKNLMINSPEGSGRLGYESKSMTLEANSFYRISVKLYTEKATEGKNTSNATASIYLTGLLDKKDSQYNQHKFESISTQATWKDYVYYVDTNESESVKLQLWLGSSTTDSEGAVFFNEVNIQRYSEDSYHKQIAEISDNNGDNVNIISLKEKVDAPVTNSSFEEGSLAGWSRLSSSSLVEGNQLYSKVNVNTYSIVNDNLTITPPRSNCSIDNQMALFMYNKQDDYQGIESSEFTIDRHTYYKLSFWAKSDCNSGKGATVMLVDKAEENPVESAKITLATTFSKDSNKFRNDWTNYTFYIYGPATASKTATIQIWLGTMEEKTSGYVFVDDFTIQKIDYNTFSSNSSATNSATFNLNNSADKYTIANSDFDKTQNESIETTYPAIPSNWTKSGSTNTKTISGIVNTSSNFFTTHSITNPNKILNETQQDNNVLMIGSTDQSNEQTYTSSDISLNANSYYKLSFYVKTNYIKNDQTTNKGASVSLTSSSKTLFHYYNLDKVASTDWHKVDIKIKTGTNSETTKLNLNFEGLNGYVFFDKVELRTLSEATYTDKTFDIVDTRYVDLTHENFDNRTFNKNITSKNGTDTPNNWTFSETNTEIDGTVHGIISSDNSIIEEDFPASLSGNTNYLYISSIHNANYHYESKESFSFNSDTYYKISINVLTRYIDRENDKDEDVNYGACIALANSNEILLKGIDTDGVWKTYTIYINLTESLTSAIKLGLGFEDEETRGEVLFDNLTITTISDEASYLAELEDVDLNTIATFINHSETEESDNEEPSIWQNNFNWIIVPSLITGLAIIIAVVGFYVRKINFSRKPKVKTNYDRRKTLDKDIDKREKIALRKQIIEELNAELNAIDVEIADFNKLAEAHLAEIKEQIKLEQEELKKQKIEIEIRKKEATTEREKSLKETPELVSNTRAEKEYNNYIAKLDKQELTIQKKINDKEVKLENTKLTNKDKLAKYLERKEYIKLQIAKIEAEIEEIAKQEEQIWAEYKAAKADAKRRKAEYKAQIKSEKEQKKNKSKSSNSNNTSK